MDYTSNNDVGSSPVHTTNCFLLFFFSYLKVTLNYSLLSCILSEDDNLIFGYPF